MYSELSNKRVHTTLVTEQKWYLTNTAGSNQNFQISSKITWTVQNLFLFWNIVINIFHFQVGEANIKAAASERSLAEANLKIDGLVTEVAGFKDMVLTSTPSKPNRHLHPQISGDKKLAAAKRAGMFSEK